MNNTALFHYYYPQGAPANTDASKTQQSSQQLPVLRETSRSRRAMRDLLSAAHPGPKPPASFYQKLPFPAALRPRTD